MTVFSITLCSKVSTTDRYHSGKIRDQSSFFSKRVRKLTPQYLKVNNKGQEWDTCLRQFQLYEELKFYQCAIAVSSSFCSLILQDCSPCFGMQITNSKMATALQNLTLFWFLDTLDIQKRHILKVCRVKIHPKFSVCFNNEVLKQCNVLSVDVLKALVSEIFLKKKLSYLRDTRSPIKFIENFVFLFIGMRFYIICPCSFPHCLENMQQTSITSRDKFTARESTVGFSAARCSIKSHIA